MGYTEYGGKIERDKVDRTKAFHENLEVKPGTNRERAIGMLEEIIKSLSKYGPGHQKSGRK